MVRPILAVLAIPLLLLAAIWAFRLGGGHLSQSDADQKALAAADDLWGSRAQAASVIGSKFYPDASNLVDVRGHPVSMSLSGCPSWLPTPTAAICPPIAVWAVKVHIPGELDEVFLIDATTGDYQVLLPAAAPATS